MVFIQYIMKYLVCLLVLFRLYVCEKVHEHFLDAINKRKVASYLKSLGYENVNSGRNHTRDYIYDFQRFAGINVTGELDEETMRMIKPPRCSLPDIHAQASKSRTRRYVLQGTKWRKLHLTWRIFGRSRTLTKDIVRDVIGRALSYWEAHTNLQFEEILKGEPDIAIRFYEGFHYDPYPFDGKGGSLAHAFYPHTNEYLSGDVHFDYAEEFTVNSPLGKNFLWVATHEIGHSLGLEHSQVKNAVMFPWYQPYRPGFDLASDDILGIQSLYGKKGEIPEYLQNELSNAIPTIKSPSTTKKKVKTTITSTINKRTINQSRNRIKKLHQSENNTRLINQSKIDDKNVIQSKNRTMYILHQSQNDRKVTKNNSNVISQSENNNKITKSIRTTLKISTPALNRNDFTRNLNTGKKLINTTKTPKYRIESQKSISISTTKMSTRSPTKITFKFRKASSNNSTPMSLTPSLHGTSNRLDGVLPTTTIATRYNVTFQTDNKIPHVTPKTKIQRNFIGEGQKTNNISRINNKTSIQSTPIFIRKIIRTINDSIPTNTVGGKAINSTMQPLTMNISPLLNNTHKTTFVYLLNSTSSPATNFKSTLTNKISDARETTSLLRKTHATFFNDLMTSLSPKQLKSTQSTKDTVTTLGKTRNAIDLIPRNRAKEKKLLNVVHHELESQDFNIGNRFVLIDDANRPKKIHEFYRSKLKSIKVKNNVRVPVYNNRNLKNLTANSTVKTDTKSWSIAPNTNRLIATGGLEKHVKAISSNVTQQLIKNIRKTENTQKQHRTFTTTLVTLNTTRVTPNTTRVTPKAARVTPNAARVQKGYKKQCPSRKIVARYYNIHAWYDVIVTDNEEVYFIQKGRGISHGPFSASIYFNERKSPSHKITAILQADLPPNMGIKTFVFTKNFYYVYDHFKMESGPHSIHGGSGPLSIRLPFSVESIDAAMTWHLDNNIYLFSNEWVWVFDRVKRQLDFDNPRRISDVWLGAPSSIDSAYSSARSKETFFTKGQLVYKINDRYRHVQADYPQHIGRNWLKCGSDMEWEQSEDTSYSST